MRQHPTNWTALYAKRTQWYGLAVVASDAHERQSTRSAEHLAPMEKTCSTAQWPVHEKPALDTDFISSYGNIVGLCHLSVGPKMSINSIMNRLTSSWVISSGVCRWKHRSKGLPDAGPTDLQKGYPFKQQVCGCHCAHFGREKAVISPRPTAAAPFSLCLCYHKVSQICQLESSATRSHRS